MIGKTKLEQMAEKSRERNRTVTIILEETGEKLEIEKRLAIPVVEALRVYQRVKSLPENMSTDISATAQILLTLSRISC